ncbi:MAG: FadR/GntR family transcriptional regulator [Planctomycetia bacterium]|nr:FadR/GntR family transcriptional regulator [Planctomycetia bacterium]
MAVGEMLSLGKRETLVEAIAEELIRYIAANNLRGGDRLPSERELVERIGASRLPLREALCMLKGLGIIEAKHGKGIFVKRLDISAVFAMLSPLLRTQADIDVNQVFAVRFYLEVGIAEVAAVQRTDENLATMQAAIDGMRECFDRQSDYVRHDMAFHQELGRATGNPVFRVLMTSIADLLTELQYFYRDDVDFRAKALAEHQEILEAVRARDAQRAKAAAREHLRNATERIVPGKRAERL